MELTVPAIPEPVKLDIERTAVIVVDMQNGFCKRAGMFDFLGILDEAKMKCIIEIDNKVIAAARRKGIKIIYLRMAYRPDMSNAGGPESPNYWKTRAVVAMRDHPEWRGKFVTVGTWDCEIVDELKPQSEDIVINKNRYSGFPNTELNVILKTLNIKYLVFIGTGTNGCVEATMRDAYSYEYFSIMVSDGCGTYGPDFIQKATVFNVSEMFGWVTTSDDLVKALK